jgi:MarR family 2-MHQ and catechol resistance regulon transcriptional repressor
MATTRRQLESPTRRQLESPTRRQPKGGAKLDGARGLDQWTTIYQAYNSVFKVAELVLLAQRISLPQLHLLAILKNGGGILTTGEIGREMVKASQTITGLVDRLEEPGFVERVFDRKDRRKTWVRMTKQGEHKLAEAFPVFDRLVDELFSVLTDQDLQDVQAKVGKLRRAAMDRLTAALARQQGRAFADL